jgi:hypothetical protein
LTDWFIWKAPDDLRLKPLERIELIVFEIDYI